MIRQCLVCGAPFEPPAWGAATSKRSRKCCSESCAQVFLTKQTKQHHEKHQNSRPKQTYQNRTCEHCEREFTPTTSHQVCCSKKCRNRKNRKPQDPQASKAWRLANKAAIAAKERERRKGSGALLVRQHYAAVKRYKSYTGTIEEYAYHLERRALERKASEPKVKKARPQSPTKGMTEAQSYKYWYHNDPVFRAWERQRNQFTKWFKGQRLTNSLSRLLGYTPEQLGRHLESQFQEGMNWGNMGQWHIDHVIPKNLFDPTCPKQIAQCWSMQNLRPLWAKDNCGRPKDGRDVLI